jgi:hypothetical protein
LLLHYQRSGDLDLTKAFAYWFSLGLISLRLRLVRTTKSDTNGEVHLKSFLNSPTINGTVFEALRDPAIFAQAQVILGAVQWPNGADLAPDTMYDAIREHGVWVLD